MQFRTRRNVVIGGLLLLAALGVYVLVRGDVTSPRETARVEPPEDRTRDGNAMTEAQHGTMGLNGCDGELEPIDGSSLDNGVERSDADSADQNTADAGESDKRPLTVRDRPDWDKFKRLPVGDPREPAEPEYTSSLDDEQWKLHDTTPTMEYRRRISMLKPDRRKRENIRRVRGRVFEVIGSERIPLAGVVVFGRRQHRTLTDDEGRFELAAMSSEPNQEDKKRGETYRVVLTAKAHGYVDFRRWHTYTNLDETDEGLELYLARRESHRIRVDFENPQLSGSAVSVVISSADYGRSPGNVDAFSDWDERRYIKAKVDPVEGAWFSVPASYDKGIDLESPYILRSVSAPGVLPELQSLRPVVMSDKESTYKVKLYTEDTVSVLGIVTDVRTREPLPNARVHGPGFIEFTVADDQGRFELITAREPRGADGKPVPEGERFLYVAHEGYAPIRTLIKDGTLSPTLTGDMEPEGGNLAGPWEFRLRPFVSATIDCNALHSAFLEDGGVSVPSEVREVMRFYGGGWKIPPNGIIEAEFFPWGLKQMQANTRIPQPNLPRDPVKIPDHCWQGDGPYRLKLEH